METRLGSAGLPTPAPLWELREHPEVDEAAPPGDRAPPRSCGAVESPATTLPQIIQEMLLATTSERQGRLIDNDSVGMQKQKEDGYF